LQEEKAFSGPESASEDEEEEKVLESERRKRPRKR
jgi:hypothetical protein